MSRECTNQDMKKFQSCEGFNQLSSCDQTVNDADTGKRTNGCYYCNNLETEYEYWYYDCTLGNHCLC